jgi:hypothetical protein
MHRFLHSIWGESTAPWGIFKWTKKMVVRGGEIGTVCRMFQHRGCQVNQRKNPTISDFIHTL